MHLERAEVDAIAIGSETLLVDDPLLTARGVYRERPLTRVVFDRRLRTPPTARLFSTLDAGPVIIVAVRRRARNVATRSCARGAGAQLELIEPAEARDVESRSASFCGGARPACASRSDVARRRGRPGVPRGVLGRRDWSIAWNSSSPRAASASTASAGPRCQMAAIAVTRRSRRARGRLSD